MTLQVRKRYAVLGKLHKRKLLNGSATITFCKFAHLCKPGGCKPKRFQVCDEALCLSTLVDGVEEQPGPHTSNDNKQQ